MPDKLEPAIRQKYILTMGELEEIRSHLQATLGDTPGAAEVLQATLSLATLDQAGQPLLGLPTQTSPVKSLADAQLPANHTAQTEHVHLVQYTPRNELDLVPEMLYEFSDQPLAEIQRVAGNWNYDQKAAMVQAYIKQHQAALTKASYSWDIVSDFVTMQAVERHLGITVDKQMASPRLGYDVPAPIEAAGFSDDFEHCFELSLELYSQLQAAGYTTEASYAVLAGHRLRWKASINLVQMAMLADAMADNQIIRQMADKVSEAHPLIAERLKSSTAISTHVTAPLHDSPTAIS